MSLGGRGERREESCPSTEQKLLLHHTGRRVCVGFTFRELNSRCGLVIVGLQTFFYHYYLGIKCLNGSFSFAVVQTGDEGAGVSGRAVPSWVRMRLCDSFK